MSKIQSAKNGTKKEAILQRAALLFRKKGFVASSMRELAEQLGVEAPSLYNHIGSKDEILSSICFKVADDYNQHITMLEAAGEVPEKAIGELIRFHVRMMLEQFDEVYVVNHEWKQLKEPDYALFVQQRKQYEVRLLRLIQKGIDARVFKQADAYVILLTLLSAVRGLEIWHRHKGNIDDEVLQQQMVDLLLGGLLI